MGKLLHIKKVDGRWGLYHSRTDNSPISTATADNRDLIFESAAILAKNKGWYKSKRGARSTGGPYKDYREGL